MATITTPLTQRLGLKTPIISAPMGFASTPEMAAAVTAGGGFGTLGATFDSSEVIKQKMDTIRKILGIARGSPVPVAFGFIGWILDMTEGSDDPRLATMLDELPTAIWLSFGDVSKYITQIHAHDKKSGRKTFIFMQVGCLEDALKYAPDVDCLVLQGIEAGGHGRADAPPVLTLYQAVVQALPSGTAPLLVVAGGISTGAQIAGMLTMGAAGVVVGTRFLFTNECEYPAPAKDAIIAAGHGATVRTLAYDEVGRTNGWPANYNGRALRNAVMEDLEAGLALEERLAKFDASKAAGASDRIVVWAGVGAGLVKDIRPTADVLKELHADAVKALNGAAKLATGS
ncbi:2-nitropropane dioxygenase [Mycena kentingensis (nom. inval.)]|nr:2-nitropropane dioxygenase [Mycena kentingensis (nom. inval.)]